MPEFKSMSEAQTCVSFWNKKVLIFSVKDCINLVQCYSSAAAALRKWGEIVSVGDKNNFSKKRPSNPGRSLLSPEIAYLIGMSLTKFDHCQSSSVVYPWGF